MHFTFSKSLSNSLFQMSFFLSKNKQKLCLLLKQEKLGGKFYLADMNLLFGFCVLVLLRKDKRGNIGIQVPSAIPVGIGVSAEDNIQQEQCY